MPKAISFKAKILFNHGFGDETEDLEDIFPYFAIRGYEVTCFDQRGAGKTSPKSKYGITNENLVYKDLDKVVEKLLQDYTGKLFLSGHSMVRRSALI